MNETYIKLELQEIDNNNRIVEREIDGSNLIMDNGEMAQTVGEIECELLVWMDERGEEQHNSRLELVSYSLHTY